MRLRLLLLAALAVIGTAARAQLLHPDGPLPTFEVATIRQYQPPPPPPPPPPSADGAAAPKAPARIAPGRGGAQTSDHIRRITNTRLLIASAFDVPFGFEDRYIVGGPAWLESDTYEIQAKIDDASFAAMQKLTPYLQRSQVLLMEQALLADRFHLKAHFETRDLPGFELTIAKGGPKLTPAQAGETARLSMQGNTTTAIAITLDQWIHSPFLQSRAIVNRTGLTGAYDFTLTALDRSNPAADDPSGAPTLFTAIQEQLGLKLEPTKVPTEVLVIDHIDRPSEN